MCGIVGILNRNGAPVESGVVARMTAAIAHRGPDADGQWTRDSVGVGARRLAVIDLSDAARQPLENETGDVVLVYNGEIYNFKSLRRELVSRGHVFRSHTDSEVIVHGYEEWGDAVVERLNGMFAFAVWDLPRDRLLLARDRFGIKPLYWYDRGGVLLFASEIKSLLEHPGFSVDVCHEALSEYFTFQNVFSDLTLFDGVRMLRPGHVLTVERGGSPRQTLYWDATPAAGGPLGEEEAAERVYASLGEAVERQLVSDVPVGAYLSGGLDSGALASLAAGRLPRLSTFTAGFDTSSVSGIELGFDERPQAEALANLLKTEHYEVVLHAGDLEWILPELVWHLEDLRVGQSYPNYYVAHLAGRFVKVVLSGAGGDELFGGYPWRYFHGAASGDGAGYLRAYYEYWQRLVPDDERPRLFGDRAWAQVRDHDPFDAFRGVFGGWTGGLERPDDRVAASLYFELKTFLHGLLVVEDRVSMAHSLETRVPFLDHELVDLAMSLPVGLKLRNLDNLPRIDENLPGKRRLYERQSSDGKAVLRRALARVVPPEVLERTKQGFSAPDATWFRGESIDYLNRLLRDPGATIYDFLRRDYVGRILEEHTSGRVNHRLLIWSLLSFEWWCRIFLQGEGAPGAVRGRAAVRP